MREPHSWHAISIFAAALVLPVGALFLLSIAGAGSVFYESHIAHSLLLLAACVMALAAAFFARRSYRRKPDTRTFAVFLAFSLFSFIFFLHAAAIPGVGVFDELIFDITEHYGLFLGSLLLFGAVFFPHVLEDTVHRHPRAVSGLFFALLAAFPFALVFVPHAADVLGRFIEAAVGATAALFLAVSFFLLREYCRAKNTLTLYMAAGMAILVSGGVIPFFYTEWNALWWYFHAVFFFGFAVILTGLVRGRKERENLETIFEAIPVRSKISTKLTVFIALLATLPLIAFNYFSVGVYRENLESQIFEDMAVLAESRENQIFSYWDSLKTRTVDFSSDGFIRDSVVMIDRLESQGNGNEEDLPQATEELNRHLAENKMSLDDSIVGILVVNTEGRVIASTDADEIGEDESGDLYFTKSKNGPFFSGLEEHEHFGRMDTIAVGAPLTDKESGEFSGVIINFFDSEKLNRIFTGELQLKRGASAEKQDLEKRTDTYMINGEKKMFIHSHADGEEHSQVMLVDTMPVRKCLEDQEEVIGTYANHEGKDVFGASVCLTDLDWVLLVEADQEKTLSPILALQRTLLFAVLAAVFAILFLAVYFSRRLTKPLGLLSGAAERISGGSLDVRADVGSKDEIGVLAQSFNHMAEELERRNREREEQEEDLHKRTEKLAQLNTSLTDTKNATLNLLEDLDEEKKKVEQKVEERTKEVEEEKTKLSHVTENMYTGAIFVDEDGEVIFINRSARNIIGTIGDDLKEVLGEFEKKFPDVKCQEYLHKCTTSGESTLISEVESGGKIYEVEFKCLDGAGKEGDQGKIGLGTFIWIRDITGEKLLEHSKSELVAVASHQLRTPLTVTRGNVEMLMDESFGTLNDKQKELLHDTEDSVIRLIGMVNDMLDITKIEKGDMDIKNEHFILEDTLRSVIDGLAEYAQRHNFAFICHEPPAPVTVFADKERVRQVFQNLLDNAVRYGKDPGKAEISCAVGEKFVEVRVSDNGIGIPAREQENIFGRFYRASNAVRFASGGSGLGLFIVKSLIEQMGGSVRFESEEGKGTTFYFTLPLG